MNDIDPMVTMLDKEREYSENVYKKRMPRVLDSDEYYKKFATPLEDGGYNHRSPQVKPHFDYLLSQNGRFLDCACGAGRHAIWLALNGKQVWAFDLSENAVELAKKSAELSGVADSIEFDAKDATKLDYKDNYFDVLTGTDCIHHLIKYPDAIRELARVLKVGGKAVYFEPLAWNPFIHILRTVNIWWTKREGEHMLTKQDVVFLKEQFGDLQMTHHMVFSALTRLIASEGNPPAGIRKTICIYLFKLDRLLLRLFPPLKHLSAGCLMQLTKT